MIEIDNLTVQFGGVRPIDALNVKLENKLTGLIGPNGAGKTTLLNVLSGFVEPVSGTVRLNGRDLTGIAPHRRAELGMRRTFQTDQIADDLTLWENVHAVADHVQYPNPAERAHDVERAIAFVGLMRRKDRRGSDLSTQERHLAEVAKALVGSPTLVMLDEPGAGMAVAESDHLTQVIRGIPGEWGAQVLLIDHDVALISACCEQTMVLDFGKLLALGPTGTVLERPEVRRAYLGDFHGLELAA